MAPRGPVDIAAVFPKKDAGCRIQALVRLSGAAGSPTQGNDDATFQRNDRSRALDRKRDRVRRARRRIRCGARRHEPRVRTLAPPTYPIAFMTQAMSGGMETFLELGLNFMTLVHGEQELSTCGRSDRRALRLELGRTATSRQAPSSRPASTSYGSPGAVGAARSRCTAQVETPRRWRLVVDVRDPPGRASASSPIYDRPHVLELLLAVHERHEVQAELEERLHAAGHRLVMNAIG